MSAQQSRDHQATLQAFQAEWTKERLSEVPGRSYRAKSNWRMKELERSEQPRWLNQEPMKEINRVARSPNDGGGGGQRMLTRGGAPPARHAMRRMEGIA